MEFKDAVMILVLLSILSTVFIWKVKMGRRKVKCNSCGGVFLKDHWDHFGHCPDCKHTECTPIKK